MEMSIELIALLIFTVLAFLFIIFIFIPTCLMTTVGDMPAWCLLFWGG